MTTATFLIGTAIIGLCIIAASFVLAGALNASAKTLKESEPQPLAQPQLAFLTEYDAADYLGVSLNELDYMRSEGLLDGAFVAVTSLEQTGEEEYSEYVDGVEERRVRPVMANVTRFLFNRALLDEKMTDIIRKGQHINPTRRNAAPKQNQGGQQNQAKQGKNQNGAQKGENQSKNQNQGKGNQQKNNQQKPRQDNADGKKEDQPKTVDIMSAKKDN